MISTIGAAIGTMVGIAITFVLGATGIDFTEAMAGVDMEISSVLYPVLNIRSTLLVFVFAVAVSGLTTWLPTRRISRIAPAVALREE
jgi:putative ABC transport system permease protein